MINALLCAFLDTYTNYEMSNYEMSNVIMDINVFVYSNDKTYSQTCV